MFVFKSEKTIKVKKKKCVVELMNECQLNIDWAELILKLTKKFKLFDRITYCLSDAFRTRYGAFHSV